MHRWFHGLPILGVLSAQTLAAAPGCLDRFWTCCRRAPEDRAPVPGQEPGDEAKSPLEDPAAASLPRLLPEPAPLLPEAALRLLEAKGEPGDHASPGTSPGSSPAAPSSPALVRSFGAGAGTLTLAHDYHRPVWVEWRVQPDDAHPPTITVTTLGSPEAEPLSPRVLTARFNLFAIPAHTEVQLATNGVCPDQVFDLRASTGRIERLTLSFWSPTPPSR